MKNIGLKLDYEFKKKQLLYDALHHSSIKSCSISFERLEFLGDRVLGLVLAEYIFKNFKDAEGSMARMHSAFVCAEACRDVAVKIGINRVIKTAGEQLVNNKTVLADAMEAVLGAIFTDSNYDTVSSIILNLWTDIIAAYDESAQEPKTRLQEICQGRDGQTPVYELISVTGPDHAPVFVVSVTAFCSTVTATGHSKKEAETLAAKLMLKKIEA